MMRARVVTAWAQTADGNWPQLALDHPLHGWIDVTAQPARNITPDPNAYTVEIICDQAMLDAIDADSRFAVLWSEEVVEGAQA